MQLREQLALALITASVAAGAGAFAQTRSPWRIGPFTRPAEGNPILRARPESVFLDPVLKKNVQWEALHTFNPAAVVRDGKVYVLYRAEDNLGEMKIGGHTSRLGLAESTDGVHFTRRSDPVFFPANDAQEAREWPGGVEDPRIVETDAGSYVLTYTQWNGKTYTVGIATSPDLVHWTKFGPAFDQAAGGTYKDLQYKSAAILTRFDHGRLPAARIHGKFWMYWGEGAIHLATSTDLVHWTPVEDKPGHPVEVLGPRPGRFDSLFPEVGPPPVLTSAGIVLLYNGKNATTGGEPTLDPAAYSMGEALFDPSNPLHLLARDTHPALQPTMPYEKTGQYAAGTTFTEGLVYFHDRWLLYYGCADSLVAVAVAPGER